MKILTISKISLMSCLAIIALHIGFASTSTLASCYECAEDNLSNFMCWVEDTNNPYNRMCCASNDENSECINM